MTQQALAAFLANAGGALASRAVGAGANAMGAFTPEEALAQEHLAELSSHNRAGENLGAAELGARQATDAARIAQLKAQFGLDERVGLGNLSLGQERAGLEKASLGETTRHNTAVEGQGAERLKQDAELTEAQAGHLNAQAQETTTKVATQQYQQKQQALQEVLRGTDPKGKEAKMLRAAGDKVKFDGNIDSWGAKVRAQAAVDAQDELNKGTVDSQTMPPSTSAINDTIAAEGLLPAVASRLDGFTQPTIPTLPNEEERAVNRDALKRFLLGGASAFDTPTPLNRRAPVPVTETGEVPTIRIPQ